MSTTPHVKIKALHAPQLEKHLISTQIPEFFNSLRHSKLKVLQQLQLL